jgi:hypothetical protein
MLWHDQFFAATGFCGGVLAVVSTVPYVVDILNGRVRPERATWLIWTVLASISLAGQAAEGATDSLWFAGLDAVCTLTILVLSLRHGVGSPGLRDTTALIVAGLGLLAWYCTNDAVAALLVTIAVDAVGAALTVWKTWEQPWTETYAMWAMVGVASLMSAVSVGRWNLALLMFPVYLCAVNAVMVATVFAGRRRAQRRRAESLSASVGSGDR